MTLTLMSSTGARAPPPVARGMEAQRMHWCDDVSSGFDGRGPCLARRSSAHDRVVTGEGWRTGAGAGGL